MKKLMAFLLIIAVLVPFMAGCKGGGNDEENEGPVGPVFKLTDEEIETFSNFLEVENQWGGGVGDPFVMRYEGMYYLYPSTSDGSTKVGCWSSKDLVHWKDEGYCAFSMNLQAAYAPEVTYFNGKFYMYTAAPSGDTHRCFVSNSPTGLFKPANDLEQNRQIDGHVFIDNDGKWYFYSASGDGVKVYDMISPDVIGPEKNTLSQINGAWTEGPMVVYHDGVYYFTYTGNHVSNRSYRIPYSTSTVTPYQFNVPDHNILLISTDGEIIGPGHSSTVKAPDLDSYYIVYHCKGEYVSGRRLNIDRIVFDGETMDVMGPTTENQPIPSMPDIYSYFDSEEDFAIFESCPGKISTGENTRLRLRGQSSAITKKALEGNKYTVEVTTANIDANTKAGVIFGYKDANNYGSAMFDTASEKLIVTFIVNGEKTVYENKLVRSFDIPYDFKAVQAIQVEKSGNTFTFYVNDRELAQYESDLSGNKVGVVVDGGEARFGYLGASDEVGGSSNCDFYKPIGEQAGTIAAHLCLEDDAITIGQETKDKSKYVVASEDQSFNYRVYAAKEGKYTFSVKYMAASDAVMEIYINGKIAKTVDLKATEGDYTSVGVSGIKMDEGKQVITLYMRSGNAQLKYFNMLLSNTENLTVDFTNGDDFALAHTDGVGWDTDGGALNGFALGKRTYGNRGWADYTYEIDIEFRANIVDAGILVRTTNAAESNLFTGAGLETPHTANSALRAEDWMQGYYIQLNAREIILRKCDYDTRNLLVVDHRIQSNTVYHLKVECFGPTITFYLNGEQIFSYTDADPFLTGEVGVRMVAGSVRYDNLKVTIKEDR